MADESPARITRVVLKNYKSIVSCDVELRPLTILVGPNGSGKSNFLDALRFVSEALTVGLAQAIRNRGNVSHILSAARPEGEAALGITLHFRLESGETGHYSFEIEALPDADFRVRRERLALDDIPSPVGPVLFSIEDDGASMWASDAVADKYPHSSGRLYLVSYSAMPEARPVFDLLTTMAFVNPSSAEMRALRPHDSGGRLLPAGENIASVVRLVKLADEERVERTTAYLSRIMPGLEEVDSEDIAGFDALRFRQKQANASGHADFRQSQVSDGTIRALAILVALFQHRAGGRSATSLVGIEEPETGVHPAAARIILGAMQDASYTTQILATTHSSDMLHMGDVNIDNLLAVSAQNGVTTIGPIDEVSRGIVQDGLFTVGDLLQMDQIRPEGATHDLNGSAATLAPVVEDV